MIKKIKSIFVSVSIGASAMLIISMLNVYIFNSAIKDQSIFTIMIAVFAPLFVLGTVVGIVNAKKKYADTLLSISLVITGALIILLAFLNVYRLQMLLPLVKTNSVSMVVMWIARIMGGLVGGFCGLSFGITVKRNIKALISTVLGAAVILLLSLLVPESISFETVFYLVGAFSLLSAILNNIKSKER